MKVLVAYDGSDQSRKALDGAVKFAEKLGGELILLSVTESVCPVWINEGDCAKIDETLKNETEGILSRIKDDLEKNAIQVRTFVRMGVPADEIVELAKSETCDAIFLGSHGRHGAKKFLLGSVSLRVAEHAPCSVFIVR